MTKDDLTPNPQSAIPNRQSAIVNPRSTRAPLSARAKWGLGALGAICLAVAYAVSLPAEPTLTGWADDYAAAISTSATTGRSALLYFTSRQCPTCRMMEQVLADPAVQKEVAAFVPVRIDAWRERELANRFNIVGVPAYVVVDSRGRMLARDIGYKPAEEFTRFLRGARAGAAPAAP